MNGETVAIRDASGRLLLRRVWRADEAKVYISAEPGLFALGFPREDVFALDPGTMGEIREGDRPSAEFWKGLSRW